MAKHSIWHFFAAAGLSSQLLAGTAPTLAAEVPVEPGKPSRVGPPNFTLPFFLLNTHIMIDGTVNGKKGRFLFDTGTEFAFFLNNETLPLAKDQLVAKGHTGSGQAMAIYRQKLPIAELTMGRQLRFTELQGPLHTGWGFLQEAYGMNSFLGSVGHAFSRNYQFTIDYDQQTIAFQALDQPGSLSLGTFTADDIVACIEFTPSGVDGKIPEADLQIGDQVITGFFDTGNPGSLELTEASRDQLIQKGLLTLSASDYAYGSYGPHQNAHLKGLRIGQVALADLRNLTFRTGQRNRLGLGYQFLKHYISVWNAKTRTITLLKR